MVGALAKAVIDSLSQNLDRPVISGEVDLSAGDLLGRSAGFAAMLKTHGCGAGSRVVLCLQSNTDMLAGMIGCWIAGASVLPMDFRAPAYQRATITQAIDATLTVEGRPMPGSADSYASVIMDDQWRRLTPLNASPLEPANLANPVAVCAVSSGTTGTPKVYLQSHELLLRRLTNVVGTQQFTNQLFLAPMSLSISATRNRVLNYVMGGGRVHFMPPLFAVDELIELLSATRASGTALPPPIIARMVQEIGERPEPYFPHLTMLRSTGGPALPEAKIAAYRFLSPGYRMAYASNLTGTVTMLAGEDVLKRPESVGRPISGVRLEIVDPSTGAPLPAGEAGMIKVHTPYLSDVTIEGESSSGEGRERRGETWGMPGDIGIVDVDGFLTIVGRGADMIVRGGINVAPQELEAILRQHPAVVDVAVGGVDDPVYGQEIMAAIVTQDGSEDDFRAFCIRHIAPEKRPRIIRIVDGLPYTLNGKLQRSRLAELLSDPG